MVNNIREMINNRDNIFFNNRQNINMNGGYIPDQNRRRNQQTNNNNTGNYSGNNNNSHNGDSVPALLPETKFNLKTDDGAAISIYGDYLEMQDLMIPKLFTNDYDEGRVPDSLHVTLRPLLILAQCFALLPVHGVRAPNSKSVRFYWLSGRVFYTFASFVGSATIVALSILRTVNTGISFLSTVDFVFFGSSTIVTILFLKLALEWPNLLQEWERSEKYLISSYGSLYYLPKKIKLMTTVVMSLALIEHTSATIKNIANALPCVDYQYNENLVETYYQSSFKQVFSVTNFAFWKSIPVSFINLIATCGWNFMDLFIMIMSVAISSRFNQINNRLEAVKGKVIPSWFWRQTRESYNRLSCLTKLLDTKLSPIVLLSFANNLYFICLQLLNSLKPMQNIMEMIYFVYSFSYLVTRTCAVSLFAATIYDESKKPVSVLFSVPSECYCIEVQRFLTQVTTDDLALTGYRFFSVTRTLMLTVAGTIVTYEIVLVQFNAVNTNEEVIQNITALCP
ncbi:gustatory receptor for sugar taste 64f-like [Lycorma delicatula]|uniref:gustatory receptor for sugar taste 64f-like n=1 Tax=Lycorma delicatula TaxID=130591 RepID=UPI003F50EDC6